MNSLKKTIQKNRYLLLSPGSVMSIASLFFSLGIFIWVIYYCGFGYDITDEGFYLNSISNPFNFNASAMQFGFLYHPLYLILKGDIAMLRQANLLISFFLASTSVWLMLESSSCHPILDIRTILIKLAISLSFSTATLCSAAFNGVWLFPTPNYNSAAFQGLLLVANGLLLTNGTHKIWTFLGWGLVGLGGWVTFMGKPTSAAILLIVVVLYLLGTKKFFIWQVFIAISITLLLLLISSIAIDGSIAGFIKRNQDGLNMIQLLGGHPKNLDAFFKLPNLMLTKESQISFFALTLLTFVAAFIFVVQATNESFLKSFLVIVFFLTAILFLFHLIPLKTIPEYQRNLLIGGIGFGGLFFVLLKVLNPLNLRFIGMTGVCTFFLLIVMPYIYAFGSNNNYWIPIGCSVFFALLATLAPAIGHLSSSKSSMNGLLIIGLGVQTLVLIILSGAFANPYRNPAPLSLNNAKLAIGSNGNELYVPKSQRDYLLAITHLAAINGFKKGGGMIDMTGHSPGVLYYLGANVVGAPWLFGGYPGSQSFAEMGFKASKCEILMNAWLLTEPVGPRSLPDAVLLSFGRSLKKDYDVVGTVKTPAGSTQHILRPLAGFNNNYDYGVLCESAKKTQL